jgi:hypothetical protein
MNEPEDKKTGESPSAAVKKPYVRPALVKLGSLSDMTQTVGNSGRFDGGFGKTARTGRGGQWVVVDEV